MPDPAHQLNPLESQADFTYTLNLDVVKIVDTSKGTKSVADDLQAVLRKIEHRHQGSIAGYRIGFQDARGAWHKVEWDGTEARISS